MPIGGAITNFPQGFTHGMNVRGMPLVQMQPGNVFWVNNSTVLNDRAVAGADTNRGTYQRPFATLAGAIAACTAGRGDIIFVGAGHAESIADATTTAMSVAGVAVVGLGSGSLRPTFTFTTANTATIPVSAADCSFQNCIFVANFLTIAATFTLSTAKNFAVQSCEFKDTLAATNWAQLIKSTGAANTVDGLMMTDCFYGSIGTTFASVILTANDINGLVLQRNTVLSININDKALWIVVSAGVLTNGLLADNSSKRLNTTASNAMVSVGGTTSSVILLRNFASALDASGLNWVVTTGLVGAGNSYSGAIAGQGFPIPALDT